MTSSEIESVCSYLSSKKITISSSNEWLKACIDWFLSENAEYNSREIQAFAFSQLLLADLNIVAQECLPAVVNDAHTIKLQGNYFLQINSFLDVGQSAYKQYQKILKRDVPEDDDEDHGNEKKYWEKELKRMLKMEMTDGVRTVHGMEYSSIAKFNNNTMVPGVKVLVKGPVECRSGILMLRDNNIDVLGGEVDSLYEVNHTNRLIGRKLNMDENLIPLDVVPEENIGLPAQLNNLLPITTQNMNIRNATPTNDNFNMQNRPTQDGLYEDNFDHLSITDNNSRNANPTSVNLNTQNRSTQDGMNEDYFEDSDIFLNVPEDDLVENKSDNCEPTGNNVTEINAKVSAFKSQLLIKDDNWGLTVKLSTSDSSIKAKFDPDLLDRLIGFSPVELCSKESEIAVNPAIRERMDSMLKKSQQAIKNLNCLMTLAQKESDELPIIVAISDESAFNNSS